jgi:hypothetical protein
MAHAKIVAIDEYISVENHFSIFLLRPLTSTGQSWIRDDVIGISLWQVLFGGFRGYHP